ncbi:TIR domain-containing protein [Cajanus cajan]|uniref:TMV resistance protein N n=1 Tax=Cajanus cajan TaxID=3821 RepID=A0A151T7C0_CAJCA|nr:TIR domain-containing protein [Cajanus cajan]KYP62958.1 TMV resistance protein N [Cajanus cajan]
MKQFRGKQCHKIAQPMYDVFINYRKADSGRAFVPLLYDHLMNKGIRPFLDTKSMKPGNKLFHQINNAIHSSKVGVSVLTRRFCDSHFCLHELRLLNESNKRLIPIFYDIKPSQLQLKANARYPPQLLQKFVAALEETKYTVGIAFDSLNGDWMELQRKISDAVIMNLLELEDEENRNTPAC